MKRALLPILLLVLTTAVAVWWHTAYQPGARPTGGEFDAATNRTPGPEPLAQQPRQPVPGIESDDAPASADASPESPAAPALTEPPVETPDVVLSLPEWKRGTTLLVFNLRLRGIVVDEAGFPRPGVRVLITSAWAMADVGKIPPNMTVQPARDHLEGAQIAVSDADGRFDVLVGCPLSFDKIAFLEANLVADTDLVRSEQVTFMHEDEKQEIRLVLPDRGGLRGRVVDSFGAPQAGVRVAVARLEYSDAAAWVNTGKGGEFEFKNLKEGRYSLATSGYLWVAETDRPTIDVFNGVMYDLGDAIRVKQRTLVRVTLEWLDGTHAEGLTITAVWMADDRELGQTQALSQRGGWVEFTDPPAGVQQMRLTGKGFHELLIQLPDVSTPGRHDLGRQALSARTPD